MKKSKLFMLASLSFMLCAPVCAQAKVGAANARGAQLPDYGNVEEIEISTEDAEADFSKSVRKALKNLEEYSDGSTQYKIIIPPGTYEATGPITLKSNVWIYAEGATIEMADSVNPIFYMGYAEDAKTWENIRITGGTWDGSMQSASKKSGKELPRDSTFVCLAHIDDLMIEDATFKVNRTKHIMEFSDIHGMTIRGCQISGNNIDKKGDIVGVQPKEAIQLDVATSGAMSTSKPFNGKGCHDVLIENNTFTKVARGFGSHNEEQGVKEKNPYTNITVRNNTIKNALGEGIFVLHWKNCTIQNNTISNCRRAGICMWDGKSNKVVNNTVSGVKAFTGLRKKTYDSLRAGVILIESKKSTIQKNKFLQSSGEAVKVLWGCSSNTIKGNTQKK